MASTIYEQPLNERMRTLLRLEHLFGQLHFHLAKDSEWDNRRCISTFIDILNLLERADLKTELIKELDRLTVVLTKLKQQPHVNDVRLNKTLNELVSLNQQLQNTAGRLGDDLRKDELIAAVKHRIAIPGGSCSFDLPLFHYWLLQAPKARHAQLQDWMDILACTENTVSTLLSIIRDSAYQEKQLAKQGFFQKTLEVQSPCQLIRVELHDQLAFPEISGSKHRISIRFLAPDDNNKAIQTQEDIPFALGCCIL